MAIIWIWGDSYRYMENTIFSGSILVALYLTYFSSQFIFSIFLFSILISLIGIFKIFKNFTKPPKVINEHIISCFNYVRDNSKKTELLATIPLQYHLAGSYFTNVLTLEMTKDEELKTVLSKGKVLGKKVSWIVSDHKISPKLFKQKFSSKGFFVYKSV